MATKTRILELPEPLESRYVTALRPRTPHATLNQPSQWIDYFNLAFALAKEYPAEGVLRYAVAALQGVTATERCWRIAQALLWQCVALDPGCQRFVIDVLLLHKHRASRVPDIDVAKTAVESLVLSSAPVGHGSEVLWSIWGALQLGFGLSPDAQDSIGKMDDAFVAVAAMLSQQYKVFAAEFESPLWVSWLAEGCFAEDHWLFAYEANGRGWYSNSVQAAKLADDPSVKFLAESKVTFVNDKKIQGYLPKKLITYGGGGGGASM